MSIFIPGPTVDPSRVRDLVVASGSIDVEREMARRAHSKDYMKLLAAAGIPRRDIPDYIHAANQTNFWMEPVFSNKADGVNVNTVAVDTAMLSAATCGQPWLRGGFFSDNSQAGKVVHLLAKGIMQTTGTPTFTWKVSISTSQFTIGTTVLGVSAGITTASGASAGTYWDLELSIVINTPGIGSGNATITSGGKVTSPAGFASPFTYGLAPTAPPTATWTNTLDGSVSQYLMLSLNPGTSSASNNATVKELIVLASTA